MGFRHLSVCLLYVIRHGTNGRKKNSGRIPCVYGMAESCPISHIKPELVADASLIPVQVINGVHIKSCWDSSGRIIDYGIESEPPQAGGFYALMR